VNLTEPCIPASPIHECPRHDPRTKIYVTAVMQGRKVEFLTLYLGPYSKGSKP